MAQGNDVVCSQSFTEEAPNTQRQRLVAGTLTYTPPELPTLPFDLLPEILCRLPVKLLVQLRCLWNEKLWSFGVLRDCLCVFARSYTFLDVWIMKECGNQESWTKLYTIPNLQDQNLEASRALYISEDDQLLVECFEVQTGDMKLVVYDSKTGILNIPVFQNYHEPRNAKVYIESLISP